MQIGEFAKICNTRISVLRHYDKLGLLPPAYTDPFSGYRYYSSEQISVFLRITALKQAGFSLAEIRDVLATVDSDNVVIKLFDQKENELRERLASLQDAKKTFLKGVIKMNIQFLKTSDALVARTSKFDANDSLEAFASLNSAVSAEGYQRISGFRTYGEPMSNEITAECTVVKLNDLFVVPFSDPIDLPFENDETIIGKWQIIGKYAVKEDFYAGHDFLRDDKVYGKTIRELYFLPGGERYWVNGWTKGYLLSQNGDGTTADAYEIEEQDGERLMFIHKKSYHYRRGGRPDVVVLKQLDHRAYTKEEIEHHDNTDLPFVNDERILGKWTAHSTFSSRSSFDPNRPSDLLFWNRVEFEADGNCIKTYGERTFRGKWTKGCILDPQQHLASAYEIEIIDGAEYLIAEWKTGDYLYGGYISGFYSFVREE